MLPVLRMVHFCQPSNPRCIWCKKRAVTCPDPFFLEMFPKRIWTIQIFKVFLRFFTGRENAPRLFTLGIHPGNSRFSAKFQRLTTSDHHMATRRQRTQSKPQEMVRARLHVKPSWVLYSVVSTNTYS